MTWKNSKSRGNLYCVRSEIVNFAYGFFSIFLNIVYGWTAQKSVINSKNFVQRILFELLYRNSKILGICTLWMSIHKVRNLKTLEFYTPCPPVFLDTLLMTPFSTICVRFLLFPNTKKNFKEISVLFSF